MGFLLPWASLCVIAWLGLGEMTDWLELAGIPAGMEGLAGLGVGAALGAAAVGWEAGVAVGLAVGGAEPVLALALGLGVGDPALGAAVVESGAGAGESPGH